MRCVRGASVRGESGEEGRDGFVLINQVHLAVGVILTNGLLSPFSFYVNGRLFWGTDRMFFVERALGLHKAVPERLTTPPAAGRARLAFFFDYSSPWAYVGFMRLDSLIQSVAPIQVYTHTLCSTNDQ